MDAKQLIEAAGGRKAVMGLTGLKRARISQWCTENYIPAPWVLLFKSKFPAIRKAKLALSETYHKKQKTVVQNSNAAEFFLVENKQTGVRTVGNMNSEEQK
jgi:hypothetical protein